MWPSRGATRPRTDNDGRAGGRRPGWIGPGMEGECGGAGTPFAQFLPLPRAARDRSPRCRGRRRRRTRDWVRRLGKKSSTQFGGWHGTRGPIHGACSDWTRGGWPDGPLTSRTRERKLLCGQAQFFMAARPTGLASSRAKSTRSATTRIDVRERRSCSFALIKSAFLIPHLRRAIYQLSHIWVGWDTESRYGFILPYDNCMPRLL